MDQNKNRRSNNYKKKLFKEKINNNSIDKEKVNNLDKNKLDNILNSLKLSKKKI